MGQKSMWVGLIQSPGERRPEVGSKSRRPVLEANALTTAHTYPKKEIFHVLVVAYELAVISSTKHGNEKMCVCRNNIVINNVILKSLFL